MVDNKLTGDVENLLYVLANMHNEAEVYNLLQDMFTLREIREISQRLLVAKMLNDGSSYSEIEAKTGTSATTIARVSKCLTQGKGGYINALGLLESKEKSPT